MAAAAAAAAEDEADWQISRSELRQQNEYVLENCLWTDCAFVVGEGAGAQEVRCHKLLLAKASPVFAAMLYGPLAENAQQQQPVRIPDVEPSVFKHLVSFVYTGRLAPLADYEAALGLCYAAKKYMLQRAVDACADFLWDEVTTENACQGFEFADLMGLPQIKKRCFKFIQEFSSQVLGDPSFIEIQKSTLQTIVEQETLNITSENELIEACIRWAQNAAILQSQNDLKQIGLQQILGKKIITQLRFLSLSLSEFATGPMTSNLLTDRENIDIMSCINSGSDENIIKYNFCNIRTPRIQPKPKAVSFEISEFTVGQQRQHFYENSILFKVNSNVNLIGIELRACRKIRSYNSTEEASRDVFVALHDEKYNNVTVKEIIFKCNSSSHNVVSIEFDKRVPIFENCTYTLVIRKKVDRDDNIDNNDCDICYRAAHETSLIEYDLAKQRYKFMMKSNIYNRERRQLYAFIYKNV